jgi:hypothetical protein
MEEIYGKGKENEEEGFWIWGSSSPFKNGMNGYL